MSKNNYAIELNGVSKTFKLPTERQSTLKSKIIHPFKRSVLEEQQALKDISFKVKKGEFFGIVGRNGSGKSTLLKIISGIYAPNKGSVKINGKLTPFIELGVGFNMELSGKDNVFLNGALLGFNRSEMKEMYDDIVEFAELQRFMDQKLKNYSSGMQVRLAFSIAIRAKSDILVLDEVLAVGDVNFQKKCFQYFAKLKQQKKTVVFVSHDTASLSRYCDSAVLLDAGKIIGTGGIDKIVLQYKDLMIDKGLKERKLIEQLDETETSKKSKGDNSTRDMYIKSCKLVNIKGQEINKIKHGVDINIDIEMDPKNIKMANVAIGIYNGLYESRADRVFGASTQEDGGKVNISNGKLRLTIKKPILRNGEYVIYVVVFGESEEAPYDYKWESDSFVVFGGKQLKSRGVIMAQHNWNQIQ